MALSYIGIDNFRMYGANGKMAEFEFAPITILTGPNNSGKSSLIKLLLLLKHNFLKAELPDLSFKGLNIGLINYTETINYPDKPMIIKFELPYQEKHFLRYPEYFFIEFIFKQGNYDTEEGILNKIRLFYEIPAAKMKFRLIEIEFPIERNISKYYPEKEKFFYNLIFFNEFFKRYDKRNSLSEIINKQVKSINRKIKPRKLKLEHLKKKDFEIPWNFRIINDDLNNLKFKNLLINEMFRNLDFMRFCDLFNNIHHFEPNKGEPSFISTKDDKSKLSDILFDFHIFTKNHIKKNDIYDKFLSKWLSDFQIGDDYDTKRIGNSISLILNKSIKLIQKKDFKIPDLGYGCSQILPIILKIILEGHHLENESIKKDFNYFFGKDANKYIENNPLFLIEEPESHLHPKLQSFLADFFVDAYNSFGSRFIIETHSEYLIRKIQYLIAKKEIKKEDVAIYYFDQDPTKEDYIRKMEIDDNGFMKGDFGEGFFDEASRLISDLWNIQNQN